MRTEIRKIQKFNCMVLFPDSYENQKEYSTILFLHGAGSRGNDLEKFKNNPYFHLIAKHKDFPFVTIAPQCATNTWFDCFEALEALVAELSDCDFVDSSRIYLMGASMGGYAVWQLAMSMPDRFAAAVPICGGGMYWNAARLVNLPIWAFHGALDTCVLVEESEKMVNAVNQKGGSAKLTVYPNNRHDAWSDTYSNPEVFEWLLSKTNQNLKELSDEYKESNRYG